MARNRVYKRATNLAFILKEAFTSHTRRNTLFSVFIGLFITTAALFGVQNPQVQYIAANITSVINGSAISPAGGQSVELVGTNLTNIAQLEAGDGFTVALTEAGDVYSWGGNYNGQLALGTMTASNPNPTPAKAIFTNTLLENKKIKNISVGGYHVLALTTDGELYSWGANWSGQLGDGTYDDSAHPVKVATEGTSLDGKQITAISAGGEHSMALTSEGNVFAWGANYNGQIAITANSNESITPEQVGGQLTGKIVTAIETGYSSSIALTSSGEMYTWGNNVYGQLGNGTISNNWGDFNPSPTKVIVDQTPLEGKTVTKINTNGYNVLVLSSEGKVYGWGAGSELGDGVFQHTGKPVAVQTTGTPMDGKVITDISTAMWQSSFAIDSDGIAYAWGANYEGAFLTGSSSNSPLPTTINSAGLPLEGKKVRALAPGSDNLYAILSDGSLFASGWNSYGSLTLLPSQTLENVTTTTVYNSSSQQYGYNTYAPTEIPKVGTLLQGKTVTAVGVGDRHTLAVTSDGVVYSWGDNEYGQLGIGYRSMLEAEPKAVAVAGTPMAGKTIVAVDAGNYQSVALASDGTIYSWGRNNQSQLGDGTSTDRPVPVALSLTGSPMLGKTITAISVGDYYTVARSTEGLLYAWGYNTYGQLGDGTNSNRNRPVLVNTTGTPMAGKVISKIETADDYTIAIDSQGAAYSWGYNVGGTLGDGTTTNRNKPVLIDTSAIKLDGEVLSKVSVGDAHVMALTSAGRMFAWGANGNYQLGDDTNVSRVQPVVVKTEDTVLDGVQVLDVSVGNSNSFVKGSNGKIYGWGYAGAMAGLGLLRESTYLKVPFELDIDALGGNATTLGHIYVADEYAIASTSDGKLYGWGTTTYGGLTNAFPYLIKRDKPVQIATNGLAQDEKLTGIAAGYPHGFAVSNEGRIYNWGFGSYSNLNRGVATSQPLLFGGISNQSMFAGASAVTKIAAGGYSAAMLTANNELYTLGPNWQGTAGNGTNTSTGVPLKVTTLGTPMAGKTITDIKVGENFMIALASDGTMYTWGDNNGTGQLGDGTATSRNLPGQVVTAGTPLAGKTVTAIAAGDYYNLALTSEGLVYSWGDNTSSQLGDAVAGDKLLPVAVNVTGTPMAGKTITKIGAGNHISLAIDSNGLVYGWGQNQQGALGDGTTTLRNKPVAVNTVGTPMAGKSIVQVVAGEQHSVALSSDGNVYAWGGNLYGQLGDGTNINRLQPVAVNTTGTPMAGKTIITIAATMYHTYALASDGSVFAWGGNDTGVVGVATGATTQTVTDMFTDVRTELTTVYHNRQIITPIQITAGDMGALTSLPKVYIDGTEATSVQVLSSGRISFVAPSKPVGEYDILVVFGDGRQTTVTKGARYTKPIVNNTPPAALQAPATRVSISQPTQQPSPVSTPVAPAPASTIVLNSFAEYADQTTSNQNPDSPDAGKKITLVAGQTVQLSSSENSPLLTIASVGEGTISLKLSFESEEIKIATGQTVLVDMDNNSVDDTKITLVAINEDGSAELLFGKVLGATDERSEPQSTTQDKDDADPSYVWTYVIIGIITIVLVGVFIKYIKSLRK
ncbi:MAG: hypothetical protein V4611_02540 [Patescibacteria group bacterium]